MPELHNYSDSIAVNPHLLTPLNIASVFGNPERLASLVNEAVLSKPSRKIFSQIIQNVLKKNSTSFLITGQPGTGKSYLALLISSFLNTETDSISLETFMPLKQDGSPPHEVKEELGKFFVIPTLPWEDFETFDELLTTSLQRALEKEKESVFEDASGTEEAGEQVSLSGSPVKDFKQLSDQFTSMGKYQGIIIVADNLDSMIEDIENGFTSIFIEQLRKFLSFTATVTTMRFVFLGVGTHKNDAYSGGDSYSQNTELSRVFDATFAKTLEGVEWMTLVTTRILKHVTPCVTEQVPGNPGIIKLAGSLQEIGLFPNRTKEEIRKNLITAGFPLHPVTLALLPGLFQKLSTDKKNLITFFRDTTTGGLRYFLDTYGFPAEPGHLSLYTPDYLYSFLMPVFLETPSLRGLHETVEQVFQLGETTPLARRIIRLAFLLQLADVPAVRPTERLLLSSLNLTGEELNSAPLVINDLLKRKTLVRDEKTGELFFPSAKSSIDVKKITGSKIEKLKKKAGIAYLLNRWFRPRSFPVEKYNRRFSTDRLVMLHFADTAELADIHYPRNLQKLLGARSVHYMGDICLLLVVARNSEEQQQAREYLSRPAWKSCPRVLAALSGKPFEFHQKLYEHAALCQSRKSVSSLRTSSGSDRTPLEEHTRMLSSWLKEKIQDHFNLDAMQWYYKGTPMKKAAKTIHELTDDLMAEEFPMMPVVMNSTIMQFNPPKTQRRIVRDAIERLLNSPRIQLSKRKPDPADKLLHSIFVGFGIFVKSGEQGILEEFRVINKVKQFSSLKETWNTLTNRLIDASGREAKMVFADSLFGDMLQPPCGMPPILLELLLAALFAGHKKKIRILEKTPLSQKTPKDVTGAPMPLTAHTITRMVHSPEEYIVSYSLVPQEDQTIIDEIADIFAGSSSVIPDPCRWEDCLRLLVQWYYSLPDLTRHSFSHEERVRAFLDVLSRLNLEVDPETFFMEHLPHSLALGIPDSPGKAETYTGELRRIHGKLEGLAASLQAALLRNLSLLPGNGVPLRERLLYLQSLLAGRNREDSLSPLASSILNLSIDDSFERQLLTSVPASLGFPHVSAWTFDRSGEYLGTMSAILLELEVAANEELFTDTGEPDKTEEEFIRELLLKTFTFFNLSRPEREVYIVELLEKYAWKR